MKPAGTKIRLSGVFPEMPGQSVEELRALIGSAAGKQGSAPRLWRLLALPLIVVGFLFLAACGQRVADAGASSVSYGSAPGDESKAQMFTIPPEQMVHVRVTPVELTRLPRVLRLTGSVAYNNFKTTPVITQVSGPTARILVSPGEVVRTGQPMLYVSSPDYAQLRSTFMKARDAFGLAEKSYNRAKDLYEHHAIAEADLQQADSTRNQALADLQAAEQSLKVWASATLSIC